MNVPLKKLGWLLTPALAALGAGLLAGCATAGGTDPELPQELVDSLRASVSADLLSKGDRVTITFSGNTQAPPPHQEQIREDGLITPPLLGTNVMAAGRRIGELQNDLHQRYVPAYFQHLTVTVQSDERYFFVGGEVRKPGQMPYLSEMTVLKAIQAAGDFTVFANKRRAELRRKDGTQAMVDCKKALRDPSLDLAIYPGDILYIHKRL